MLIIYCVLFIFDKFLGHDLISTLNIPILIVILLYYYKNSFTLDWRERSRFQNIPSPIQYFPVRSYIWQNYCWRQYKGYSANVYLTVSWVKKKGSKFQVETRFVDTVLINFFLRWRRKYTDYLLLFLYLKKLSLNRFYYIDTGHFDL